MVVDNQATDIKYKIGIIGPTRVGKTSMISAMLEQGQTLLAGTNVSLQPVGETKARMNRYLNDLNGSLMAGEFNPGGMSGTREAFTIELAMSVGNSKLTWAILDYPGGWIDEESRPLNRENEWNYCQTWINESIVLLVPIDAAVVMESCTKTEFQAAYSTLQISQAAAVAREWAKGRIHKGEPGLLILVPVKCETYFGDNGGQKDKSEELFDRIKQFYQYLLDAVEQEIKAAANPPKILIQYHPIDTIGCVAIKTTKWLTEDDGLRFEADYLVRPPRKRCPKGADGLLITICRQIANTDKNKERALFSRFWRWFKKEDRDLNNAIETLQAKPLGDRVQYL
jgi:hypothetical protein